MYCSKEAVINLTDIRKGPFKSQGFLVDIFASILVFNTEAELASPPPTPIPHRS